MSQQHVIDLGVEDIDDLDPARILIVCTGSQGEPRAALTQMANGRSKFVELGSDDTVLFSSHPIPGNEAAVGALRTSTTKRIRSASSFVHRGVVGSKSMMKLLESKLHVPCDTIHVIIPQQLPVTIMQMTICSI